jgi:hypothetical protein
MLHFLMQPSSRNGVALGPLSGLSLPNAPCALEFTIGPPLDSSGDGARRPWDSV